MTGGHGAHLGFGCDGRPLFWIGTGKPALGGCHVAFAAPDWVAADVFYKAALTAGGRDNGGLDDISDAELAAVPISYADGAHDNWMQPPVETRHL